MSNFEQVYNILGQQDDKGYQAKLSVPATVQQVKGVEYSKSSGKPGQSVFLRDNFGGEAWVKIQGKFDPLSQSQIGRTYEFLVWPFKPDNAPKTYLYAWIQRQVNGPQTQPQTPPQRPRETAQGTNPPNMGKTPRDTSIERQACFKGLCELAANRQDIIPDMAEFFNFLHVAHKWVETGEVDMSVTHVNPTDAPDLPPELRDNYVPE